MTSGNTRIVALALCGSLAVGLAATIAPAAVVGPLTFDQAADYTDNFAVYTGAALLTCDPDNIGPFLRYSAASNNTARLRYDSDPGSGTHSSADFLTETISFDTRWANVNNDSSLGLFARLIPGGAGNNTGILALININTSGSFMRLRLFHGASASDGAAGTNFFDQTFNISANAVTADDWLHVVFTQTDGDDPAFSLTVSKGQTQLAATGQIVLTATDAYNQAGSVGFRIFSNGANTIDLDNFTIVPEPAAISLLGLGAVLLIARRRNAR